MKIGFFLMTKKGYNVLYSIVGSPYKSSIAFICIGRDKNLVNDYSFELEQLCITNNFEYSFRDSFKSREFICDYYFVISWRWIIDLPNLIVLHDSLLPKYRGFAPLVNMLINGETKLGVSAILASGNYDEGPIIEKRSIQIEYPIKIEYAIELVANSYWQLIAQILGDIQSNSLKWVDQNNTEASYSLWLDSEDYFINWSWSAEKIVRKIDACGHPYDGAKSFLENEVIVIKSAELEEDRYIENRVAGKVLFIHNGFPIVVCGSGLIKITDAQYFESQEKLLPIKKFRVRFK